MSAYTISIATIPGRESGLKRCLGSLPTDIPVQLYTPELLKRKNQPANIPLLQDITSKFKNVTLHVTDTDNGSIDKLYHTLAMDYEYIITLDDDMRYSPELVYTLIEESHKNPDTALCFRGKNLMGLPYKDTTLLEGYKRRSRPRVKHIYYVSVHIITAVWGALYRRDFFDREELLSMAKKYPTVDDIVISGYLEREGILKMILPLGHLPIPLKECRINELFHDNRDSDSNDRAIRDLLAPHIHG